MWNVTNYRSTVRFVRVRFALCECIQLLQSYKMWNVINYRSIFLIAFFVTAVGVTSASTMSTPILRNHINGMNGSKQSHTTTGTETEQDELALVRPRWSSTNTKLNAIIDDLQKKYHHQPLFLQAVQEMILSIEDLLEDPLYCQAFAIITEPERTISFRVTWVDDHGTLQINRGWRIELNR